MRVAKTKALISFAVTAKLICVFVFAYAKSRFSHDAAHMITNYCDNKLMMKSNYQTFIHKSWDLTEIKSF